MPDVAVKVEGLRELRSAIIQAGDKELGNALKRANKSAAERVAEAALPNVPVGPSGKLVASVKALASQSSGKVKAGAAKVPYAAAIHWGTGPRSGEKGPHNIRRRPFIYEAAAKVSAEMTAAYEEEIDRLVDQFRSEKGRDR